ncbi:von Willebrand factor A domain-containing protein 1 isoform X10 [Serinus canaria]|uniref:von Willebrand factor A domain-containing protein 1 isoform X10 n=1 Tax=Serinus canaria TaxID=9135 RepID=UPI0021CC9403|nr:von Willebrand factor A domain-containing protein 1 isoform X10 [Serinus canaria]
MALKGVGGRKENSLQEPELAAQPNETRSGERQDGFGSRTMTELGLCWAPSGGFKAVWAGPGSAMLAKVLFSLLLWLRFAAGQDTPEPAPQPSTSNTEGDLLFLLDSSASVSRHEFSKVKEFMWDLLQPFTFGPRDVQTSIIHISTTPSMEFPFDQHLTSSALQKAIGATRQLMGDTNTGQALSYAREKLFSSQAGARPDVPKVLVWVTDGFSTDDISEPMQLLKDRGVTVFIVSTGRGNFLQLSAAASPPSDRHLHFVDVDDLPIITPELRDAIRDVIQANRLHATDVTSSSFRLVWPQLLSQESGFYSLEYGPGANPAARRSLQVPGAQSSLVLSQLAPGTTYEVTLVPESNERYFPPQSTRVTTLPGKGTGLGAPGSPPCQVPGSPPCQVKGQGLGHQGHHPARGNQPSSGSHLRLWAPQLPGELGSRAGQRGHLPGAVRAPARELSPGAAGGWQAQQHPGGAPGTQHHLPGDSDSHLQVWEGEIPVSQGLHPGRGLQGEAPPL